MRHNNVSSGLPPNRYIQNGGRRDYVTIIKLSCGQSIRKTPRKRSFRRKYLCSKPVKEFFLMVSLSWPQKLRVEVVACCFVNFDVGPKTDKWKSAEFPYYHTTEVLNVAL